MPLWRGCRIAVYAHQASIKILKVPQRASSAIKADIATRVPRLRFHVGVARPLGQASS